MPEAPCPITRKNEGGDVVLRVEDAPVIAMVLQSELNRGRGEDGVEAVGGEDDAVVRVRGSLNKMLVLGNVVVLSSILMLRVRKRREEGEPSGGATDEGVRATRTAASAGGGRRLESPPNNPCGDVLRISTNSAANEAGVGNRQHTVRRGAGCCFERGNVFFCRGGEMKRQGRALLLLLIPLLIIVFAVAMEGVVEGRKEAAL